MKLATTTCDFDRYTEGYLPKIKEVSAAGFRYIDLSLYTVEPDDELMLSTDWETHLDAIAAYAADHGLTFVQCHSPDTNPLDPAPGIAVPLRSAAGWAFRIWSSTPAGIHPPQETNGIRTTSTSSRLFLTIWKNGT